MQGESIQPSEDVDHVPSGNFEYICSGVNVEFVPSGNVEYVTSGNVEHVRILLKKCFEKSCIKCTCTVLLMLALKCLKGHHT